MANKLDLADAQFIGYFHGKWNRHDIIGLVEGMGLTKKEWIKLKTDYVTLTNVDESDILEIDEYFKIKQ